MKHEQILGFNLVTWSLLVRSVGETSVAITCRLCYSLQDRVFVLKKKKMLHLYGGSPSVVTEIIRLEAWTT